MSAPAFKLKAVEPLEQPIVKDVLDALGACPRVVWCARMNVGTANRGQFMRFGFPGLADVIGQTTDGLFFAIEVKRPDEETTPAQAMFLHYVRSNCGRAGIAHSDREALAILKQDPERHHSNLNVSNTFPLYRVLTSYYARKYNLAQWTKKAVKSA